MPGIISILDIAKKSLLVNQAAMNVTGNNIANVNSKGYNRQEAITSPSEAYTYAGKYFGSGVDLDEVRRVYDKYLVNQFNIETANLGKLDEKRSMLERIEAFMTSSEENGLGSAISDFFNSLQDLANDPSSSSARTAVISEASYLADLFHSTDTELDNIEKNIDFSAEGIINEINSIAERIAGLNEEIANIETSGVKANDLRDDRDLLLNDLASKIDITYFEDDSGQVTVMINGGKALVHRTSYWSLKTEPDYSNENILTIKYIGEGNTEADITNKIQGGKLKGLLDIRNDILKKYQSKIDTLAYSIINEINILHQAGRGLDGSTGNLFFNAISPSAYGSRENQGSADVSSVSVLSPSSLTYDNYEIRFTSSSSFDIYNTTTKQYVSTGNSYSSGSNIDFEGLRVVLSDSGGTPASGDIFYIKPGEGAAKNIEVNSTISSNINKIAAGLTSNPGDNENALQMGELQFSPILDSGSSTFEEYYGNILSDLGNDVLLSTDEYNTQEGLITALKERIESKSGVSLDEELSNLLKFQHSYQASAKLITVADELLDTLVNLIR
ncbi:MAG: flagellar hook-associated protein FlgK [Candidatus Schekmanbacteria bacterium]|nr:MAG: flagellar hook-associated protein FlgK [Candidatus Schekmanbacteria bacterium]